jgi:hypothetical protein
MFIGHYAVAFGCKRLARKTSLGTLLAAALFLDLLWPLFLLLGWESVRIAPGNTAFTPLAFTHYPITHSLLSAVGWAVAFAGAYFWRSRYLIGALVVGALVISHWLLDAVAHRADLPLYPGSDVRIGLGLWNSRAATLIVESGMFAAGLWIYVKTTRPLMRHGTHALGWFVAVVAVFYLSAAFGPPPPDAALLAWLSLGIWLFPVWALWIDEHRLVRAPVSQA